MSQDVLGTLQKYLAAGGGSIDITPDISAAFGPAIGTAVTQLFSGGISVNGANFSLTGDAAVATISGEGSAAPLLSSVKVLAVFTASGDDVTLKFDGSIETDLLIKDAWPAALNFFPFDSIALTGGDLTLDVDPGAKTLDLTITPTVSFESTPLGTGLFEVSYDGTTLGWVGGAMVTGSWTPFKDFPVLSKLTINGEFGAFFATVDTSSLTAFAAFPFVPDSISAGFTVIGMLEMDGPLSAIESFLPDSTKLELTAIIPKDGGLSKSSVTAGLSFPTTTNAFAFTAFDLEWQSTSPTSGTISLNVGAVINISKTETLTITGSGSFLYGTEPSLNLDLTATAGGDWLHPFGIPSLTIESVSFACTLNEEGIAVAMSGCIEIGTGQPNPVLLDAGVGFVDFEVPDYVAAELSATHKTATVTLGQLVTDFLPVMDFNQFPLLAGITFADLQFWAVANTFTIGGKTYNPGIGASGTISFFGYELDFGFNLTTSPKTAVQAKGVLSYQGGPIVISGGGINWLTISNADGTAGAAACIDTTGADYCSGIAGQPNAYFAINARIELLGLVGASIVALATNDVFELDMDLAAGNIFSEKLHVLFNPKSAAFAGSIDTDFSPPDITLGPWGCIPQFTIPTPKVSVCLGLGTILPTSPICADQYMPESAPYFHFDLHFSFVGIDFDIKASLEAAEVTSALSDFGSFILKWLADNAKQVLDFILTSAELLTKLLLQIVTGIADLVSYVAGQVAAQLKMAFADAYKLAGDIWDGLQQACSVVTGNDAMQTQFLVQTIRPAAHTLLAGTLASPETSRLVPGVQPSVHTVPQVLADLMNTPRGDALLLAYYLHRDEAERILRHNPQARMQAEQVMLRHRESPEFAEGLYLPFLIELIQTAADAASPAFQDAARQVVAGLDAHREKDYGQLLQLLHAA